MINVVNLFLPEQNPKCNRFFFNLNIPLLKGFQFKFVLFIFNIIIIIIYSSLLNLNRIQNGK